MIRPVLTCFLFIAQLAAQPADSPKTAWSALPVVDPWVITGIGSQQQCTSLAINAGSSGATGVHLVHSTLTEATTRKPLGRDDLRLCLHECVTSEPLNLPPNTPVSVTLCVLHPTLPGVFKGNIYLAADHLPDTLTIPLDIQITMIWYKLGGLLLLALGVWMAVIVIPYTQARGTRDQELVLAARRRVQVTPLLETLRDLPGYRELTVMTRAMLESLLDALSVNNLEKHNYLSPADPSPLTQTVDSPGYAKFLDSIDSQITNLDQIVTHGILFAAKQNCPQDQIEIAIRTIDALSSHAAVQTLTDLQPLIDKALQPLTPVATAKAMTAQTAAAITLPHRSGAAREKSLAQLEADLKRRRFWLNSILVILTVTSGALVLITPNAGFGIPQDYIYCLLWGFGLPVAGQQLTPAAVRKNLSA